MQPKLSLISRTNQMSHLWRKTFRVHLGVFENIKVALSGDTSTAGMHKPQWNFFSLPKCTRESPCSASAESILQKKKINPTSLPRASLAHSDAGTEGVILGRADRHLTEARQIRSQSTPGLVQTAYIPVWCIRNQSEGKTELHLTRMVFSFV